MRKRSEFSEKLFYLLTGMACLTIVLMITLILGNIFIYGRGHLSWEFLTASPEQGMTAGGIFPAIYGTVLLVFLMTVAVVPVGVMVAIYLNEYSSKTSLVYKATRLAVSNLAGVPSIVFGLFGLGFFVKFVGGNMDRLFYGGQLVFGQPAIIWAALTLAVLTLPVVILTTEDTLRSIPNEFREASMALGATKSQTIMRTVLPQALTGILTGGILAVSRGAGEVAPILFTGAAYFLPDLPSKLHSQFMELGYHIYVLSTQSPDVEATRPILYSTVFVLLALTFLLNLIAIVIRSQMRARLRRTG
ncbi:MAG: phosphate ABC transporter permease PtsA [Acidobacteria bacterium]|nr:MAG: phosphate ABC transporter permease PtsA [Acidobacteriota bacterium]